MRKLNDLPKLWEDEFGKRRSQIAVSIFSFRKLDNPCMKEHCLNKPWNIRNKLLDMQFSINIDDILKPNQNRILH